MTVKDLINRIEGFDLDAEITCVNKGDNPLNDYSEVADTYEIRGSQNNDVNRVIIQID